MSRFPVGTRIRFPRRVEGISETQGPVVFAEAGEAGEIMGYGKVFPYSVKVDSWKNPFGANPEDFNIIAAEAGEKSDA